LTLNKHFGKAKACLPTLFSKVAILEQQKELENYNIGKHVLKRPKDRGKIFF